MVSQRRLLTARQRWLRSQREARSTKGRARQLYQELRPLEEFRGKEGEAMVLLSGKQPVWVRDGWQLTFAQCGAWCRQQGKRLTARVMARWLARSEEYRCGACGRQLSLNRDGPLQTCCVECSAG